MTETTSTDPASTEASADAGSGGAQGASEASASGSTDAGQLDARVRQEQSRADRAEARIKELEALTAKAEKPEAQDAPTPVDPEALIATALSRFRKTENLRAAARDLRESHKFADESLFETAEDFESPEAFQAAVESSHNRVKSLLDEALEARTSELHAELKEKYGIDLAPATPAGNEDDRPKGDPTAEQLARMTMAEFNAVPAEVVDRVLRSNNS